MAMRVTHRRVVILLDCSYQEHSLISVRRAIKLLFRGVAEPFGDSFYEVKAWGRCVLVPKVLRLVIGAEGVETIADAALNERDYGDLTGKNKWEVKEQLGEEEFLKIRRSWDYPPKNGESLKNVYERVVPFYESRILPELKNGKNVIIAAHGNSLRALVKFLENIPDEEISKLEMKLGEPYVYEIDETGKIVSKEIRSIGSGVA